MFKVNNRNTRTRCKICSDLTIKTPERYQASFWFLYCLLWTYFTPCSRVYVVNFEQVNAGRVYDFKPCQTPLEFKASNKTVFVDTDSHSVYTHRKCTWQLSNLRVFQCQHLWQVFTCSTDIRRFGNDRHRPTAKP